jgi:hypothetical protein
MARFSPGEGCLSPLFPTEFLMAFGSLLATVAIKPSAAVRVLDDVYVNRRLGLGFMPPDPTRSPAGVFDRPPGGEPSPLIRVLVSAILASSTIPRWASSMR